MEGFICEKIERQIDMLLNLKGKKINQYPQTSFNYFNMFLRKKEDFQNEDYQFEIKIPEDIKLVDQKFVGKFRTSESLFKALSRAVKNVKSYVFTKLDVPIKLNVSKKTEYSFFLKKYLG
jgi:hypothetical protein